MHRHHEDKNFTYGARGIGPKYEEFYRWARTVSYRCTSEDWPWDYFRFTDPKDEEIFIEKWFSRFPHFYHKDDEADD
jgi:hypothetical protein